jgi:hypothetical protein
MILEIAIGAGVVAAASVLYRAVLKRQAAAKQGTEPEAPDSGEEPKTAPAKPKRSGPRGLLVGDVLLYADEELWLAGCVDLDEEGFAVRLFPTPGAKRASWVAQLDPEGREIALLKETDEVPEGRVPESLPIAGLRLALRRRGHARVSAEGDCLPLVTEQAAFTVLGGAAGKTLVVVDFVAGDRLALAGERVTREMLELLPGGDA